MNLTSLSFVRRNGPRRIGWMPPCLLAVVAASACDLPTHVKIDAGQLCLQPEQVAAFSPGDRLDLEIRHCISACSEDGQASCSATVDDQIIRIVSEASWSDTSASCILVCESLVATCSVHDLQPGTYLIEHGEDRYTLDLPADDPPPCPQPD